MIRTLMLLLLLSAIICPRRVTADVVTEWNSTMRAVIQHEGLHEDHRANPGWSTRAMAMMNGAIYDVFQAIDRTHAPYLANLHALPDTSRDAAVHQAAYELLSHCYDHSMEADMIQSAYDMRMDAIGPGDAKDRGIALGSQIANLYMASRADDHANEMFPYTVTDAPGHWEPDPMHPDQSAWGPGWRYVDTFTIGATQPFIDALPGIPELSSQEYTDAWMQVKEYGALDSDVRTDLQTEIGLFWAYDRPSMGPPPVVFLKSVEQIAKDVGTSPEENARLFAMASVSMADAAIAAWDAKFEYDFWRPITAIRQAGEGTADDYDSNADTVGDPAWQPLGAPGAMHEDGGLPEDDFSPPFPAWPSGHATMGSAAFKTLELFLGTNSFEEADEKFGSDATSDFYTLESEEMGSGMSRNYQSFTQVGPIDIDTENSPEGENAMSRIYLGIHWIFDQRDGATLGRNIAAHVYDNAFFVVPEPGTASLSLCFAAGAFAIRCARRRRLAV